MLYDETFARSQSARPTLTLLTNIRHADASIRSLYRLFGCSLLDMRGAQIPKGKGPGICFLSLSDIGGE